MVNFVFAEEMSYFIQSIKKFSILDIGSPKWLDVHEIIIKLSQQAVLEAAEDREEEVKELLITHDKLRVLVHEAYCVQLWKLRVLPHLLEIDPNPHATFLIYTVLFHEASVIGLLDTALYHVSGVETLKDSALDLVDYCAQAVAQVIGLVSMGYLDNENNVDVDEAVLSEIERQKRDIVYQIGMRCISILQYMTENCDKISISVGRRMVVTHDIPWLIVDVLCFKPWQRKLKKGLQRFIDNKWINVQGEDLPKVTGSEAQAWFCLHQLLFNKQLMESYTLNEGRCQQLLKALGLMHDILIDQLPPLIQLKQHLSRLSIGTTAAAEQNKVNLILEEVPEIREQLLLEAEQNGGFLEIAQQQEKIFLCKDKENITGLAQRLSQAYNTEILAEFDANPYSIQRPKEQNSDADGDSLKTKQNEDGKVNGKPHDSCGDNAEDAIHYCGKCDAQAQKKCGNCRQVYYCSRKCQQEDWPKHKPKCQI